MVCSDCRDDNHRACREESRQASEMLTDVELTGSQWCDCQHGNVGDEVNYVDVQSTPEAIE